MLRLDIDRIRLLYDYGFWIGRSGGSEKNPFINIFQRCMTELIQGRGFSM